MNMKLYNQTIIILLFLSFVWTYTLIDLTYATLFQERGTMMNLMDYTIQYKIIYILGTFLLASYLGLVFYKKNKKIY